MSPREATTGGTHPPLTMLVALLCVVSGSVDAIAFLRLGDAFASVMTGNIVFLGLAAGTADLRLATFCSVAIGGYVLGVLGGSRLTQRWTMHDEALVWPTKVNRTLGVQLVILVVMALIWVPVRGSWQTEIELALLWGAGMAMGLQGAAVRSIGVSVSTTYMTGALTTLLEAIATRRPFSAVEKSAVGGLLALALGALLGSAVNAILPEGPLLVPIIALVLVLVIHHLHARRKARKGGDAVPRRSPLRTSR